jgi:hypothetical protein
MGIAYETPFFISYKRKTLMAIKKPSKEGFFLNNVILRSVSDERIWYSRELDSSPVSSTGSE